MSADELSKTKWIKSVAKVPTTMLKDLILRYDTWIQSGGVRASTAGPLAWEADEECVILVLLHEYLIYQVSKQP